MNTTYLEQAKARVPNIPMLINMVSRRARQLISGQRPMVKPDHPNMDRMDVALKEIAEGKLTAEVVLTEMPAHADALAKAQSILGGP